MPELEDELGDIIAKARRGLGIDIDELALRSGIATTDIGKIENYQLLPEAAAIRSMASALRLDPGKLEEVALGWSPGPFDTEHDLLTVERTEVPFGDYFENCYIFAERTAPAAAIVDPGGSVGLILERVKRLELIPDLILITHTHADHVGGLKELVTRLPGIRVAGHHPMRQNMPHPQPIRLGELFIRTLQTPGHSPESVCYHVDGAVFAGDTLFAGSIGRPMSSEVYSTMLRAIDTKVLSLPDETVIYPGHGPATTVKNEKRHNPFFGFQHDSSGAT